MTKKTTGEPRSATGTPRPRNGMRRGEILDAAADLFWARGYGSTPMSTLARELDLQKASLYHYAPEKEALLLELSLESMDHMLEAAAGVAGETATERLENLVRAHVETLLAEQSRHATALVELRALSAANRDQVTRLRDRYDRIVEEAIEDAQRSDGRWPGSDPKTVRLALLGMLNWSVFWYRPGGSMTPADLAVDLWRVFAGEPGDS